MADSPSPDTPTRAARALIAAFAGALALKAVETFEPQHYLAPAAYAIAAIVVAIIDYKLPWVLAKAGQEPTRTLNLIATDARWWVGIFLVFLLVVALSPFVEQRRWPFVRPDDLSANPIGRPLDAGRI